MRRAPPIQPGIPLRNSAPSSPASAAKRATWPSNAPAPTMSLSPSLFILAKWRPSRITTPRTPPSLTSRLEPTPITCTGISRGRFFRNSARSASSSGLKRTSAGPPTWNQVIFERSEFARSRPRTAGIRSINPSPFTTLCNFPLIRSGRPFFRVAFFKLARQGVRPCRNGPRAEADYDIARAAVFRDNSREMLRPLKRDDMTMTTGAQPLDKMILVDPADRGFTGGIDISDDHRIGVVEAGAELFEQVAQARIAMRLHHGDHLLVIGLTRSGEHGGDFDGMMAIVIDDRNTFDFAGFGKAPLDAAEIAKAFFDDRFLEAHFLADGNGAERIQDVMNAGHRQFEPLHLARRRVSALTYFYIEKGARAFKADIDGAIVRL